MKAFLKPFLLVAVAVTTTINLNAQVSFSHSVGLSYFNCTIIGVPAIVYSPRVNLVELSDNATVSVGSNIGIGGNGNSRDGFSDVLLNLPLLAELNLGTKANPDNDGNIGGFVGAGFGFNYMSDYYDENSTVGIVLNGGIRANIMQKPIEIRASYQLSTNKLNYNVFGVSAAYFIN